MSCFATPFYPKQIISGNMKSSSSSQIFKPTTKSTHSSWTINIPQNHSLLSTTPSNNFNFLTQQDEFEANHAQTLEILKHTLSKFGEDDSFEGLDMIDAIQRLGIDYHFEQEIKQIMVKQCSLKPTNSWCHEDLHHVALRFRLLRQEGYYVSPDVFDSFKDKDGKLKQTLYGDIKGLMSLYEASQLSINGEDLLNEAGNYCEKILNSWVKKLDSDHCLAGSIENTLKYPHHKISTRFMAKNFTSEQHCTKGWMHSLQGFAKSEFKIMQSQFQHELGQVSKWWKELGLSKDLVFARDQPLKWYTAAWACLANPSLEEERIELTKPISFVYLIDDIFDVYGTLDELILFTDVINRWEIGAAESLLPDYMKICFKALDNITNEISYKVYAKHGWNPVDSLRKAWSSLCNAFLVESRWFASEELPNGEEYIRNGIVSSGVHVVLAHVFFLLGESICKENVQLIDENPPITSSAAKILRLWDDLGSAKDEDQDGHDGSYLECYMKEHQECSVEDARKHAKGMILEAWKSINQEFILPNPYPQAFTKASLNLARMVPLGYSYDEDSRLPILEEHIKSLLHQK